MALAPKSSKIIVLPMALAPSFSKIIVLPVALVTLTKPPVYPGGVDKFGCAGNFLASQGSLRQ